MFPTARAVLTTKRYNNGADSRYYLACVMHYIACGHNHQSIVHPNNVRYTATRQDLRSAGQTLLSTLRFNRSWGDRSFAHSATLYQKHQE